MSTSISAKRRRSLQKMWAFSPHMPTQRHSESEKSPASKQGLSDSSRTVRQWKPLRRRATGCASATRHDGICPSEYVRVEFGIDTAESMEAIREREEAERARAAAEAEAKRVQQKEAVFATASELDILAALIQCEAGGEPYEGQVAVGAVVMNRVRNGGYPNSITEVIYASGQFVPASGGRMESLILNKTTKASCVQAAQEAINGACNVGDALHFRRNNGRPGLVDWKSCILVSAFKKF